MILTKTRKFLVSASKSFSFLSTSTKVQCFFHLPVQCMFWFNRFLQATVAGVSPSQPPCVQVSAVRAVSEYCSHLSSTDRTHVLQPFIGSMVDGLLNVVTLFSTDVIALCLETLCVVLEVVYWYAVGIVFVVGNCDDRYLTRVQLPLRPMWIMVALMAHKVNTACVLQEILPQRLACPGLWATDLGLVLANFLLPSSLLLWLCKVSLHRLHDSVT